MTSPIATTFLVVAGLGFASWLTLPAHAASSGSVKLTGYFACEKCTAPRVAKGDLTPSNPECAKQCIEKGTPAVFISEQGKELLTIVNFPAATEHLGYHLEVTGKVDATAKTIAIDSVNRLEFRGASCSRTAKRKASQ